MVYIGTMTGELHGVDADTGKPCAGFGKNGVVDVNAWAPKNSKWKIGLLQPPAVYKDTLILGWAGNDWVYKTENPGTVYGIDARTGSYRHVQLLRGGQVVAELDLDLPEAMEAGAAARAAARRPIARPSKPTCTRGRA